MGSSFWWCKLAIVGALSVFFLFFGVTSLLATYDLRSPQEFVLSFFGMSLVILISLVGMLYPILQIREWLRLRQGGSPS